MQLSDYLFFAKNCEAALDFYASGSDGATVLQAGRRAI